jgi:hypothetical protein
MARHAAPGQRHLDPGNIERLMPAGPNLAVIDLFHGVGNVGVGATIHDFQDDYRVVMVLVFETPAAGARLLAELKVSSQDSGGTPGGPLA